MCLIKSSLHSSSLAEKLLYPKNHITKLLGVAQETVRQLLYPKTKMLEQQQATTTTTMVRPTHSLTHSLIPLQLEFSKCSWFDLFMGFGFRSTLSLCKMVLDSSPNCLKKCIRSPCCFFFFFFFFLQQVSFSIYLLHFYDTPIPD
ncbi:hypothetical protein BDL97_16G043500 [Sphagnum fallax]|nr:hypothetical protein BDL97_16G043500 [Sphagnum fallax]